MREGSRRGEILENLRESTLKFWVSSVVGSGRSEVTGFEALGRGVRVRFGDIEGVGVLECVI